MFNSFEAIEKFLTQKENKKIVVLAGATDDIALKAVVRARRKGIVNAKLIGNEKEIVQKLVALGESEADYDIIDSFSEGNAAKTAIKAVVNGQADFPMKGLMQTANFLMALKVSPLYNDEDLLNEATIFHYADQDRLLVAGDCAVNIAPSLAEKKQILNHLVKTAQTLGAAPVHAAALSVIEKPVPTIPSSMDAHELAALSTDDVIVEGPLALDNILDEKAAKHKGITSAVAGKADVIVMPDIHAGNIFHKSVHFFGHYPYASILQGAKCPVVMNSRTDSVDAKYNSILIAALDAQE